MAASESHESRKERLRPFIADWIRSGAISTEFRAQIEDLIRRRVGERLSAYGDEPIDGVTIGRDLARDFAGDLEAEPLARFTKCVQAVTTELLEEKEPSEVTRLLWAWDPKAGDQRIEEDLFGAMEFDLRKRAFWMLRRSSFGSVQHKIEPGELVSELYMKLKDYDFMHLPANRKQFYAMAERIIENILRDMQKAAWRGKRPRSGAKVSLSDAGESPFSIDSERVIELKDALGRLPDRTAELLRLKCFCGCKVAEISEILGLSPSTVKRDLRIGLQALQKLLG